MYDCIAKAIASRDLPAARSRDSRAVTMAAALDSNEGIIDMMRFLNVI
jgi:hypothetical protein